MRLQPRQKKLIIVLAFMPFLVAYICLALAISDHVPGHPLVQLLFYITAGMAWAVPLKPVMGWMNSPPAGAETAPDPQN